LLNTFTGTKAWVSGRTIGPSDDRYRTKQTQRNITHDTVKTENALDLLMPKADTD